MEGPLPPTVPYKGAMKALVASEKAITESYRGQGGPITDADLYGIAIGRRGVALSCGFRAMVEQGNDQCALPIVRMQLDTVLRLYAGFFVTDHQAFCRAVRTGSQVNRLKSDTNELMTDKYLVKRVATRNPWITDVYDYTSGYIHFSERHISEAFRVSGRAGDTLVISTAAFDLEPRQFVEPIRCIHHLNLILGFALRDWFVRMCRADGIVPSAKDVWGWEEGDDKAPGSGPAPADA